MQHSVNRPTSGTLNHTLGNNSFVQRQPARQRHPATIRHQRQSEPQRQLEIHNGNWNHYRNNFFFYPVLWLRLVGSLRVRLAVVLQLRLWLYGYNYYGYGYGYPGYDTTYAAAPLDPTLAAGDQATAENFTEQGEINFKAAKYQEALRDWQHALVDDPKNGGMMLLVAQTLFALGKYDEAAGATQAAMQMLPEDKWGVIGTNYMRSCTATSRSTPISSRPWKKPATRNRIRRPCTFCSAFISAILDIRNTP